MNYQNKAKNFYKSKNMIKKINQIEGAVKIYPNNTIKHETVKFQIAWKLKNMGFEVWTEAEFEKPYKGRCDVFALDRNGNFYIIEVLESETDKEFQEKIKNYPQGDFNVISVKAKDFKEEEFKL